MADVSEDKGKRWLDVITSAKSQFIDAYNQDEPEEVLQQLKVNYWNAVKNPPKEVSHG